MKKKPLTPAERDWLAKLQSLLNECPSDRLGAYRGLADKREKFPRNTPKPLK